MLAGRCMLPQRLGWQPYLVLFKSFPNCLADGPPLDLPTTPVSDENVVDFVTAACQWWDRVVVHVRERLQHRDAEMQRAHTRKRAAA